MCSGGARKRERRYTPHLPVYEISKKVVRQEYVCSCQGGKAGGKMSCKMNLTIGGGRRLTKTKKHVFWRWPRYPARAYPGEELEDQLGINP
jgi:hypothetical protein